MYGTKSHWEYHKAEVEQYKVVDRLNYVEGAERSGENVKEHELGGKRKKAL